MNFLEDYRYMRFLTATDLRYLDLCFSLFGPDAADEKLLFEKRLQDNEIQKFRNDKIHLCKQVLVYINET